MGYLGKSPETTYSIYTSEFIATAGQTIFNANYGDAVEVYLNGSLLSKTAYSATNGVDVVLNVGATIGDRIVTNGYSSLVQSGVDSIPINGSTNAVSSNGVFDALVLKSEATHNHTGIYEPVDANIVRSTAGVLPILSGANLTNLPAQVNITGNAATVTNGLYTTNIGTTVQAYDANTAKTNVAQTFTTAQRGSINTITYGATITPDFAVANNFVCTLTGNVVVANPTNIVAGQYGKITLIQDATGTRTVGYGTYFKFAGGTAPTLVTTANSKTTYYYEVASATEIVITAVGDWK